MLEHHPLMKEFPEYKERMHELKLKNRHFDSLIEKYEALDKHVFRVESEEEVLDDVSLENLKKERLKLKDEIYAMIIAK
ncbi:DUF465 domain-containing protein [Francisellaceae bacterium CB300]|jgi:uncharacterized protein YdcH (DUF465 family)